MGIQLSLSLDERMYATYGDAYFEMIRLLNDVLPSDPLIGVPLKFQGHEDWYRYEFWVTVENERRCFCAVYRNLSDDIIDVLDIQTRP
mgnify:CR=1 FL=1